MVRSCTVNDVLRSSVSVPFSTRSSWHSLQHECESLRRTCAHLQQGTTPSKKDTNIRDVKRYLQNCKIARDGLVVTEKSIIGAAKQERIVVPRQFLHALLECLHIKLLHPSKSQLKQVFCRAFYALDLDAAVDKTHKNCHTCTSLQDMPNKFMTQSSTSYPSDIGSMFAADVIQRYGQHIFVMREYISSFTYTRLIVDEKASTLRDALSTAGS